MANKARFSFGKRLKSLLSQKFFEELVYSGGPTFSRGLIGEIHQPINDGVSLSGIKISTESLFTVWRNHPDVFACVREMMNNTGSQGYMWVNKQDESKDANAVSVKKAEDAFKYNGQSFRTIKEQMIKYVKVSGNAYLFVVRGKTTEPGQTGKVLGFEVIDPRTISAVTNQYGDVLRWIQTVKGTTKEYNPDEILHLKLDTDPNNPVFGISPIEPMIWEVRTDLAAMISNYALFSNDSVPGAQYVLDEGLTDDEQDKAYKFIKDQLEGPENNHRSVVLPGVREIKNLRLTQRDMEFGIMRKLTTEKVCAGLGVPKAILNYTDGVNYANGDAQERKFWEGTINPLQGQYSDFINNQVLRVMGIDDIELEFHEKSFKDQQWDEASGRADLEHGVYTINEIREMRGYQKYEASQFGEFVDQPMIWNGMGVVPVGDLGIGMNPDGTPVVMTEDQVAKELAKIAKLSTRAPKEKSKPADDKSIIEKVTKQVEQKYQQKLNDELAVIKKTLVDQIDEALKD